MFKKLKVVAHDLKRNIIVYQLALKDPRTPRIPKIILGLVIAYILSPIDIIPDFIPVIGHIDDVVVIPILVQLAIKLIPEEVIDDCRDRANNSVEVAVTPKRNKSPIKKSPSKKTVHSKKAKTSKKSKTTKKIVRKSRVRRKSKA